MKKGLHIDVTGEQAREEQVASATEVVDLALDRQNLFSHRRRDGSQ